jgi:hypothetical protein
MEGFDSGLLIRAEADIFSSEEGFYCINEKVKRIIDRCGFAGLNLKELSGTKWFVLNVSLLVEADKTAYSFSKAVCTDCGRAREITGLIQFISQIRVPPVGGTFCSPTFDRGGSMNTDRDLFASEDIVAEFKRQSIKAGTFYRLLRAQEEIQYRTAVTERRIFKWPKGAKVII